MVSKRNSTPKKRVELRVCNKGNARHWFDKQMLDEILCNKSAVMLAPLNLYKELL